MRALEEFEPDYVDVPGLYENYGLIFDLNHMLEIDTRFAMEQIIDAESGRFRQDNLFRDPKTGQVPNWLLYFQMNDCYYCEQIKPNMQALARQFHQANSPHNYVVATINCSTEEGVFMCQYFYLHRMPRFVVLRPETTNRFY